jgi:hypothetical protein
MKRRKKPECVGRRQEDNKNDICCHREGEGEE